MGTRNHLLPLFSRHDAGLVGLPPTRHLTRDAGRAPVAGVETDS